MSWDSALDFVAQRWAYAVSLESMSENRAITAKRMLGVPAHRCFPLSERPCRGFAWSDEQFMQRVAGRTSCLILDGSRLRHWQDHSTLMVSWGRIGEEIRSLAEEEYPMPCSLEDLETRLRLEMTSGGTMKGWRPKPANVKLLEVEKLLGEQYDAAQRFWEHIRSGESIEKDTGQVPTAEHVMLVAKARKDTSQECPEDRTREEHIAIGLKKREPRPASLEQPEVTAEADEKARKVTHARAVEDMTREEYMALSLERRGETKPDPEPKPKTKPEPKKKPLLEWPGLAAQEEHIERERNRLWSLLHAYGKTGDSGYLLLVQKSMDSHVSVLFEMRRNVPMTEEAAAHVSGEVDRLRATQITDKQHWDAIEAERLKPKPAPEPPTKDDFMAEAEAELAEMQRIGELHDHDLIVIPEVVPAAPVATRDIETVGNVTTIVGMVILMMTSGYAFATAAASGALWATIGNGFVFAASGTSATCSLFLVARSQRRKQKAIGK